VSRTANTHDMRRLFALSSCLLLLQACSDSGDGFEPNPEPSPVYRAEIVWTEYGIPHVAAADWGGLGYGQGYAYAQQNFCVTMKEAVRANGESARYLGDEGSLENDFVWKLYNSDERIRATFIEGGSDRFLAMNRGFAAGMNRYLRETGVDGLPRGEEGCRGAEWVREITLMDMGRINHRTVLRGSGAALAPLMVAARPPAGGVAAGRFRAGRPGDLRRGLSALGPAGIRERLGLPRAEALGSNAYAIGGDASRTNSGLLFGNPHFPWRGIDRFWMSHIAIPGEMDAMGATLHGIPGVLLGFNRDVAWSHTVSTADRFTFHELTLNPDNPLEYIRDGETVALEPVTVRAEFVSDAGEVETAEHTFYLSRFGPVVDLGALSPLLRGWPLFTGTVIAYRDINLENFRHGETAFNMGAATNLAEFREAIGVASNPWTNTIAADRFGDAFYGDISAVPHVDAAKLENCVRGTIAPVLLQQGFVMLDGSDSACDLGSDEDGAVPGVFGYGSLPKLETREYAANANDSYWLSNPRNLLTGFPAVIGREEVEQSYRTRLAFVQAEERLAGTDGLGEPGFTNENLREILRSARNYPAELVNDDLVGLCEGVDWSAFSASPEAVARACEILADWDKRHTVDSVGGHIFFEFWRLVWREASIWAVPFDPADPVGTPRTLNVGEPEVVALLRRSLANGVRVLLDNGIPLDAPWGEVQFDERNGERIPIHGASGAMAFSVITSELVRGEGYSDITHGNSYIQTVSWDESDCPDANAILTYSQSTDPASEHYADATGLYSRGGWIDMPFCEADRDAQEIRRETVEE